MWNNGWDGIGAAMLEVRSKDVVARIGDIQL